jgi:ABC-type antimicrobial peptide transport system permease subunit
MPTRQESWDDLWLVVKAPGDPRSAERQLTQTIKSMDPIFAVRMMTTGPEVLAARLARPRALAWVFSGLATTALVLAAIGLFGVLSAYVRDRRREIAVRGALGATPTQLRALVLGQTVTVAATGVICGVPLALLGSHGLRSVVSGIEPTDAVTIIAVAAVLIAVVAVATYLPMLRASRVDVRTVLAAD